MRKPLMNNFIWLNPSKWHKWFSWAKFFTIPSRYYYSLIPTQWYLDFLVHSGEVNCLIRSSPPPPITHKDPLAASHIATRRDKIEGFYRKKDRARELNKRKERIFFRSGHFCGGREQQGFLLWTLSLLFWSGRHGRNKESSRDTLSHWYWLGNSRLVD